MRVIKDFAPIRFVIETKEERDTMIRWLAIAKASLECDILGRGLAETRRQIDQISLLIKDL